MAACSMDCISNPKHRRNSGRDEVEEEEVKKAMRGGILQEKEENKKNKQPVWRLYFL